MLTVAIKYLKVTLFAKYLMKRWADFKENSRKIIIIPEQT